MRAGAVLLAVLITATAWGQTRPAPRGAARTSSSAAGSTAAPQQQDGGTTAGDGGPADTFPPEGEPTGGTPTPKPGEQKGAGSTSEQQAKELAARQKLLSDLGGAPDDFLAKQRERLQLRPTVPEAQGGMADVISEVVLILGEIVVERATNRAFELLKDKVEEGLACALPEAPQQEAPKKEGEPPPKPKVTLFPRTCEVVAPLRLQELAVTTSALQGAILQDAMSLGLQHAKALSGGKIADDDYNFLVRVIRAGLVPHLARPHRPLSSQEAHALVQDILSYATAKAGKEKPCAVKTEDEKHAVAAVVVTAGAALAACLESSLMPGVDPNNCAVMQFADRFAAQCSYIQGHSKAQEYTQHARIIAQHLYTASSARIDGNPKGKPDVRIRMGHAVDAVFELSCRFAGLDAGCDSIPGSHQDAQAIGILRTVSHAAMDRDTNALIGAASRAFTLAKANADETEKARRAFRVVGGVLQYAETYYQPATRKQEGSGNVEAVTDSDREEAAHASRRKILESLTEEMTDRTGRDSDTIFSLGGSLRATAGIRFPSERGEEFEGPLSLPLGLGVQIPLTDKGGHGFHLEAGIVDLGRYVAIRDRTLEKFDAGDALAPSFSAGYYWGQQFPFIVAASAIYQPLFVSAAQTNPALPESVGAWSLGINVGVYVPLFDLN